MLISVVKQANAFLSGFPVTLFILAPRNKTVQADVRRLVSGTLDIFGHGTCRNKIILTTKYRRDDNIKMDVIKEYCGRLPAVYGPIQGFCEHGNESWTSIKGEECRN